MKYKLDQRIIDKSIQLRKEFLKSVRVAMNSQNKIMEYLDELNTLKDSLDDEIDNENFIIKIQEIEQKISIIEKEMSYHLKKREYLESEEKKLCDLVLDKYPKITEDEIKSQILPYIENLII